MMEIKWNRSELRVRGAEVSVKFLLSGCKKWQVAKFYVELHEDGQRASIRSNDWSLKGVPKRIRDRIGEGELEWLRAECARLFCEHEHGLALLKTHVAEEERKEKERRKREIRSSMLYSFNKALEAGYQVADIESMLREAAVKKVMEE